MPRLVKEKATCNSTFVLFFIYLFIKSSFFFKKKTMCCLLVHFSTIKEVVGKSG